MSVKLPLFNESGDATCSARNEILIFEAIVISLASVAGILTNIFNIVVVPHLPGMSIASKVLYSIVFITDIFGSLTAFLTLPGFVLCRWVFGETFCLIFALVWNTCPRITSTCLFLLAINKYIYVTRPLRYEQIVTPSRLGVVTTSAVSQIVFNGPVSLLFSSSKPSITFDPYAGACDWAPLADGYDSVSNDITITFFWLSLFLVTIICVHSHIACITRRHSKTIKTRQKLAPRAAVNSVSMTKRTTQSTSASGVTSAFTEKSLTHLKRKPDQVNEFQEGTSACTSSKTTNHPPKSHGASQAPALVGVSEPSHTTPTTLRGAIQPLTKDPHKQDDKAVPQRQSAEWKAVKMAILLSGAFFLGFLPEVIYKVMQITGFLDIYQVFITVHLLYMNRVWWNALIFYYGRNAYRLKVRRLFRCLKPNRVDNISDS